jgi:hypothetical protein
MSDLSDIAGAVAGGAASANPISLALSVGKDLIDRFLPDPAAKAAALAHLQDQQITLALTTIDQQNKAAALVSANLQNDRLSGPRAGFCWMVVALLAWNYALCPIFHKSPMDLPFSIITCFTLLLLGTSGMDLARTVSLAPGDSNLSVLGVKVSNKS